MLIEHREELGDQLRSLRRQINRGASPIVGVGGSSNELLARQGLDYPNEGALGYARLFGDVASFLLPSDPKDP